LKKIAGLRRAITDRIASIDNHSVITLVCWTGAVVALDHAVKFVVVRSVGGRSIRLSPFGELRIVPAQVWLMRGPSSPRVATIWIVWLWSAICLTVASAAFPPIESAVGLLLGGSLSHAIETSRYGKVSDYICIRLWPSFDLADIALAIGAGGIAVGLLAWIRTSV
jgi:signal peptidase II